MWCFKPKKQLDIQQCVNRYLNEYKDELKESERHKVGHLTQKEKMLVEKVFYVIKPCFRAIPVPHFFQVTLRVNHQVLINQLLVQHIRHCTLQKVYSSLLQCKNTGVLDRDFYSDFQMVIAHLIYIMPHRLTPQFYNDVHTSIAIMIQTKQYIPFFKFIRRLRNMSLHVPLLRRENFESLLFNIKNVVNGLSVLIEIGHLFSKTESLRTNFYLFEQCYHCDPAKLKLILESLVALKKVKGLLQWEHIVFQDCDAPLHEMIIGLNNSGLDNDERQKVLQKVVKLLIYTFGQLKDHQIVSQLIYP